jgi:hypothetical protein
MRSSALIYMLAATVLTCVSAGATPNRQDVP